MDMMDYVFIVIAYGVAGAIKGLTGIGFSTSCLPIMAMRLDMTVAIPLVIVPSVVSNVAVMIQAGGFANAVRRFWQLYLGSVPGLLLGLWVLVSIDVDLVKAILGLVLIVYTLWAFNSSQSSLSVVWEQRLKGPVGFCTGFINGLTGSQMMPSMPYLLSLDLDRNAFVQAINISFTLSSLVLFFGMTRLGYVDLDLFLLAVAGLIPVLTTVYLTGRLQRRLSGSVYRKLVLVFLLIMGLGLMMRAAL